MNRQQIIDQMTGGWDEERRRLQEEAEAVPRAAPVRHPVGIANPQFPERKPDPAPLEWETESQERALTEALAQENNYLRARALELNRVIELVFGVQEDVKLLRLQIDRPPISEAICNKLLAAHAESEEGSLRWECAERLMKLFAERSTANGAMWVAMASSRALNEKLKEANNER